MTGTLQDVLDYVGNRIVDGITNCKAVYSAAAGTNPDDVHKIPSSFDASITCLVWPSSGQVKAGNTETFVVDIDVSFWIVKENPGTALQNAVPLISQCLSLFRTDNTLGGNAAWFLLRGFDGPIVDDYNGVQYLVTTLRFQALLMHFSHDYSPT